MHDKHGIVQDKVAGHFSKFGQVDSVIASADLQMWPVSANRLQSDNPNEQLYISLTRLADEVDIKRLPDGTSRGFAFVKFVEARITEVSEPKMWHQDASGISSCPKGQLYTEGFRSSVEPYDS